MIIEDELRNWITELAWSTQGNIDLERGKKMTDLRRKLIALFSALVILAAAIALTGCKGKEKPAPKPPAKQPMEEL